MRQGQRVELVARIGAVGRRSMQVQFDLHAEDPSAGARRLCTRGRLVVIALDADATPARVAA